MSQLITRFSPLSNSISYKVLASFIALGFASSVYAQDETSGIENSSIEEIQVTGRKVNLVGEASSASEGVVSQAEIAIRPLLRTGEVLETVPGVVATQHSGPGKANQYFLRGFNLDHGTDFATVFESMPVNMRTHGHGQGYTDLNFIIPELVGKIEYQKGTYYPGVGDFSGTGTVRMFTRDSVGGHNIKIGSDFGKENWKRGLAYGEVEFDSPSYEKSSLIYGAEIELSDGHWDDIDSDLKKKNLWLKQQWQTDKSRLEILFMGYDNSWNSADQIPQRAVDQGIISQYGSINTTSAGESSRYSLSTNWNYELSNGDINASFYLIDYELNLWADFTYFLEDPVNGDQHNQVDNRKIYGWDVSWTNEAKWGQFNTKNTLGTQMRYDDIDKVGIYRTTARQRTGVFRIDAVKEWSTGLYWKNEMQWTDQFRSVLGVRYDYFDFSVDPLEADFASSLLVNGGDANANITTASLSLIYAFNSEVEAYLSVGEGFHSNDARGTTIELDPVSGDPAEKVDPLVETLGYEFGLRTFFDGSLNASIALWALDIDSELVFIGDSGTTEDTGVGSQRNGIELTGYYYLNDVWTLDVEYALSNAEFNEAVDGSRDIPGALEKVFSAGVNAKFNDDFYANLRLRHFGEYALDGGRTADASTIVNLRLNYAFTSQLEASLDILNLFDSDDRDIQYVYESQLATEASPVEDFHFHVFEPRSFHLNVSYTF
ncbi:MAG: TonB-dependent receptor [Cellvibrionaceae bacterium]